MYSRKHQTYLNENDNTSAKKSCDHHASQLRDAENTTLSADAQWRTPGPWTSVTGWGHVYSVFLKKIVAFQVFTKNVNWDGSSGAMDPEALKQNLYQLKKEHDFVPYCVITDADTKSNVVLKEFNEKFNVNVLRGLGM